jgi:hypothetical protein
MYFRVIVSVLNCLLVWSFIILESCIWAITVINQINSCILESLCLQNQDNGVGEKYTWYLSNTPRIRVVQPRLLSPWKGWPTPPSGYRTSETLREKKEMEATRLEGSWEGQQRGQAEGLEDEGVDENCTWYLNNTPSSGCAASPSAVTAGVTDTTIYISLQ